MREVKHLRASAFALAIDLILVIFSRTCSNAEFRFFKQGLTGSEDHRFFGADRGARGFLTLGQALFAEFAFHDFGIEAFPAELRHIEGAGNLTIAAANTEFAVPANYACFRVFFQTSKHAGGGASGIDTVHALLLHKGERGPVRRLVKLNDGFGD